jgi:hypothetical protein
MFKEVMCEVQQQLSNVKGSKENDDLNQQLQECIDQLYELKSSTKGDLDINGSEAYLITEDLVSILKALFKEISFPNPREVDRKRKRGLGEEDQEATKTDNSIKEMRVAKKMRGILDSSQTVQIRDSSECS